MRRVLVGFWIFCISVSITVAQTDRGTITGTVSDQTGAVIPGASITAVNAETAAK
jgi:hypothetical protein